MIWQWKANKGAPYAEDMGTYGDALRDADGQGQSSADPGRTAPSSADVCSVAYPWPVPDMSQHQAFRRASRAAQVAQQTGDDDDPGADARHHRTRTKASCSRAARSSWTTGCRP